jgi:hypothetical protein
LISDLCDALDHSDESRAIDSGSATETVEDRRGAQ